MNPLFYKAAPSLGRNPTRSVTPATPGPGLVSPTAETAGLDLKGLFPPNGILS